MRGVLFVTASAGTHSDEWLLLLCCLLTVWMMIFDDAAPVVVEQQQQAPGEKFVHQAMR